MKVDRWILGETLCTGSYSWLIKGYDSKDDSVVALKFINKTHDDWDTVADAKHIQNEIEALRKLNANHVETLLSYDINATYPHKDGSMISTVLLVHEYLPGGLLFDVLLLPGLNEKITRTYFKQLVCGLEALHDAGISHGNIKPQNLLLDASSQLKITSSFSLAPRSLEGALQVGSRGYESPETLRRKQCTSASDIFSCGVVLFILLSGYPPFEAATAKCRWYAPLANGNAREFWKQHRGCGIPGPAKDLITRMLWFDAQKRLSVIGTKKHKWYNAETFTPKDLFNEIANQRHLMEIKRRQDSEKQSVCNHSIKRSLDVVQYTLGLSVGGGKDIHTFRKYIEPIWICSTLFCLTIILMVNYKNRT